MLAENTIDVGTIGATIKILKIDNAIENEILPISELTSLESEDLSGFPGKTQIKKSTERAKNRDVHNSAASILSLFEAEAKAQGITVQEFAAQNKDKFKADFEQISNDVNSSVGKIQSIALTMKDVAERIKGTKVTLVVQKGSAKDIVEKIECDEQTGLYKSPVLDNVLDVVTYAPRDSVTRYNQSVASVAFMEVVDKSDYLHLGMLFSQRDIAVVAETNFIGLSKVSEETEKNLAEMTDTDEERELLGQAYFYAIDGGSVLVPNGNENVRMFSAPIMAAISSAQVSLQSSTPISDGVHKLHFSNVENKTVENGTKKIEDLPLNMIVRRDTSGTKGRKKETLACFSGDKPMSGSTNLREHITRVEMLKVLTARIIEDKADFKSLNHAKNKAKTYNQKLMNDLKGDLCASFAIDVDNMEIDKKNGSTSYLFPIAFENHEYADQIVLSF